MGAHQALFAPAEADGLLSRQEGMQLQCASFSAVPSYDDGTINLKLFLSIISNPISSGNRHFHSLSFL